MNERMGEHCLMPIRQFLLELSGESMLKLGRVREV